VRSDVSRMDEARARSGGHWADELLDDRHLLDALLEYSPDHLYFKDRRSRFVRVSRSLAEWMGLRDPLAAIGMSDADFFAAAHAQKASSDEDVILRTGRALIGVEEREVWPDGRETWVSTTKAPLRGRDGRIIGVFGMSRDITARKAAEDLVLAQAALLDEQAQALRDLAVRDDLTGLLNRRGFFEAAQAAMHVAREQSLRAVMLFVDLDDLKTINDTQGHAAGDRALVAVAAGLHMVTNSRRFAGRVGGDEFCVMETGSSLADCLSEAVLQKAISEASASAGLPDLSASIGTVEATADDDVARLIARSDSAMYASKERRSEN
jgi:diguanylate cyclase (GGDEF)-like protein/PAS domain S-box-containing protein